MVSYEESPGNLCRYLYSEEFSAPCDYIDLRNSLLLPKYNLATVCDIVIENQSDN